MDNNPAGIKLYGVINGRGEGLIGAESAGDAVYTVPYREISCLVSDTTDDDRMVDKKGVLKGLLDYQNVMERVISKYTVIPIRFGTWVETREDVLRVLESGYT
ncbi:MAG: GvpL/GvpF family gas vesicle protein [Deltaproteobacteria bacterium]|nr:GvpL/GvpF family gas vesicle protein [Deltaproteobacteria bacterium]